MTKRFSYLLCMAAVIGMAVSCDKSEKSGSGLGFTVQIEDFDTKGTAMNSWDGGENVAVQAVVDGIAEVRKYNVSAGGMLTAADGYSPFGFSESMAVSVWYPFSEEVPGQWSVQSDQSDPENYQASDLLYAPEFQAVDGNNDVVLFHQTAKVTVSLNVSDGVTVSDVRIGKSNIALQGTFTAPVSGSAYGSWKSGLASGSIVPAEVNMDGAAKCYQAMLIPQNLDEKTLIVVTLDDGTKLEYTPSMGAGDFSAGGNYEFDLTVYKDRLTVSTWNDVVYTAEDVKPGDYFYSDGTWSDGGLRQVTGDGMLWEDNKPAPVSGKTVIGIVFCTDPDRIGQGEKEALAALGVSEPHGLVLSTKAAVYNSYFKWFDKEGEYIRDEKEIGLTEIGADLSAAELYKSIDADIEGFRNNTLIRTERAEDLAAGYYEGFKAALDFAQEAGGPDESAKTTGWYVPANGQLLDIFRHLLGLKMNGSNYVNETAGIIYWQNLGNSTGRLNELMNKIPASQKTVFEGYNNALMSASQGNEETMRYIDFTESGYLDCLRDYKNRGTHVRCVLAF